MNFSKENASVFEMTHNNTEANPPDLEILKFDAEDEEFIEQLIKAVRSLLCRKNIDPETIVNLGGFLHALERLPLTTEDIFMTLTLTDEFERQSNWQDINITGDQFRLCSGYRTYDPRAGSDWHTTTELNVETDNREGEYFQVAQWVEEFVDRANSESQEITVINDADTPIHNWEFDTSEDTWDRLP